MSGVPFILSLSVVKICGQLLSFYTFPTFQRSYLSSSFILKRLTILPFQMLYLIQPAPLGVNLFFLSVCRNINWFSCTI